MWRELMDKNLVTLYELQLYVKSWGNSNNDRVKIFLDNVFQIGISRKYDDIFPMEEFEYGDLLMLDQEFIYNEYLKFLEKNEVFDDVLFHIAESEYPNFYEQIKYAFKPLQDIQTHFKTRKKLIEEEAERKRQEEIEQKKHEELMKKLVEEYKNKDDDEENKSTSYNREIYANERIEMNQIDLNSFFPGGDIYTPPETFEERVRRQMGTNINKDLQANIYARIRIEEHLKDINKVRSDIGKVFKHY